MKKAKNGLIRLMDYQHFKHNIRLKQLIEETVEEYQSYYPLPDDAMDISAAGEIDVIKTADKEDVTASVPAAKEKSNDTLL